MLNSGCLSRCTCDLNSSRFRQLQTGAMPIIPPCADITHLKKNKLCFQWKKASKIRGYSFAAAQSALTFEAQNIEGDVQDNWRPEYSDDKKEIDPKEAQRRMKTRKGSMLGKEPRNKGTKHTPEMLAIISERTKQALANPKIKLKSSQAQSARQASQSKEKKEEMSAILTRAWEKRRKRLALQQTCMVEWKESIAESARRGADGEDELQWDSYYTLRTEIHEEWLRVIKAIRADPKNVMSRRKNVQISNRLMRRRNQQPYKDPQAGTKLQMIKRIRADRVALELKKREAMEQAMLLIAEAVEAIKSLEPAATVNTSVQASLLESCRLIDKAIYSMQIAESSKSTDSFMLERDFSRPTYRDTHFMDRSEVADHAMPNTDDNYQFCQSSLSKSGQKCGNALPACKSETYLRSEISRSLYHDSYEFSHPISSPETGLLEVARSINSSIGSRLEGTSDKVSEKDAMLSESNSIVENTILIDKQENPDWKGNSRPAGNITKDIISSIPHNMNLFLPGTKYSIHDTDEKSEVTPLQSEKYKKKKWVRGRLIEVEEH